MGHLYVWGSFVMFRERQSCICIKYISLTPQQLWGKADFNVLNSDSLYWSLLSFQKCIVMF